MCVSVGCLHLVCKEFCLIEQYILPVSCSVGQWPTTTWYTLERAVGEVGGKSKEWNEKSSEMGRKAMLHFDWKQNTRQHSQMIKSVQIPDPLHVTCSLGVIPLLLQCGVSLNRYLCAQLLTTVVHYSFLFHRFQVCLICICMPRGHLIGGEVGIEMGWKAPGGVGWGVLYKETLKGGMNEQTSE